VWDQSHVDWQRSEPADDTNNGAAAPSERQRSRGEPGPKNLKVSVWTVLLKSRMNSYELFEANRLSISTAESLRSLNTASKMEAHR
jgi:hypothetical protein